MFRHNSNNNNSNGCSSNLESTPNDNYASFLGLNGLNLIGGLQDMYLDTSTLSTASLHSTSSTNTYSPPTTPLTPDPTPTLGSSTPFGFPTEHNLNATMLGAALNAAAAAAVVAVAPTAAHSAQTLQNAILLQQQQYHYLLQQQQKKQQQLALAGMAQQQLALATAAAASQHHQQQQQHQGSQQDEIAHSLKMFAMLSAYKAGNESANVQLDVMQDFAANGYTSDELNRYQYQQAVTNTQFSAANQNFNALAAAATMQQTLGATSLLQQQQPAQAWLNLNLNDQRNQNNSIWRPVTGYTLASNTAATAAAAASLSSNRNGVTANSIVTELSNNNKSYNGYIKTQKRHSSTNKISSKHCVFCENNNEPEAVVKSHSVRDSLGRVLCPKLRTYVCPICKESGDLAHTIKYCPKKPIITMEDSIKAESFRLAKSAYYKQQMKV